MINNLDVCYELLTELWCDVEIYNSSFASAKLPCSIELKGLNLDKIWESLITDIGDIVIEEGSTLDKQIEKNDAQASLKKQIEDLEKKARAEKQPRKRLEIFERLKQLKNEKGIL